MEQGQLISEPAPDAGRTTVIGRYLDWLNQSRGLHLADRAALWRWSVTDIDAFWRSIVDYFAVTADGSPETVLAERTMPFARWFPDLRLNYAEHVLRHPAEKVAVRAYSQTREPVSLTYGELRGQVARLQQVLRDQGVGVGDRVVGYLPNVPETIVGYLATAGLGATWASCASEFGARSVIERFGQIEPAVLIAAGGYVYGEKRIDRRDEVAAIAAALPSVRAVIDIEYGPFTIPRALPWSAALAGATAAEPTFERVAFDHPLAVLFSSGTTGLPKAIVHGHGGILLEHFKNHGLSWDVTADDTLLWYSTTAWMMWNALVSTLLFGATIVTIDGNPVHPAPGWQWDLARETGTTIMGAAPGFVMASRRAGLEPGRTHGLHLRTVASAGAPLPPEGYQWLHEQFPDAAINVGSGGTDICSGIVQGDPLLPVWAGRISGPALGVAAYAFNEHGEPVVGALGELVITEPIPSMPVGFWGDDDGTRLRETYFDTYPGVWRHGDWIQFEENGSCHVAGRSDATLNRGGVRLGTAEFYRVVEEIDGVADSLVVHLDGQGDNGELILFLEVEPQQSVEELRPRVVTALRNQLSPRHVPDTIRAVPTVPRNRTGKKLELPVKKILQGRPLAEVASVDALAVPTSLDAFVALAAEREVSRA
ncbi:acetoacetate--CoA ligase [Gordonia oryzae]|uniref:Acetoacetate--CoA ligase n=1 Tax=Gordonia oryzae TaxID=2487349 RepID=A0A3N4GW52_9ACTN|nr:acetoacetate--CoA ligase [Gordonia oryzae]